jgi:hypothetical protein
VFARTATDAAASLVPTEKRGFALSVVVAGLSAATALGAPIGMMKGSRRPSSWPIRLAKLRIRDRLKALEAQIMPPPQSRVFVFYGDDEPSPLDPPLAEQRRAGRFWRVS